MDWNKVIIIGVLVSLLLLILPSLFKGGEFQIENIEQLKEQISPIWQIIMLGLSATAVYTLLYKYKKKERWSKQDFFILLVVSVGLYFIWTKFLSPAYSNILAQNAAYLMNAVGVLP